MGGVFQTVRRRDLVAPLALVLLCSLAGINLVAAQSGTGDTLDCQQCSVDADCASGLCGNPSIDTSLGFSSCASSQPEDPCIFTVHAQSCNSLFYDVQVMYTSV